MTIGTLKDRLQEINPHQYSDNVLNMWIKELEKDLCEYILHGYKDLIDEDTYDPDQLADASEILIDEPTMYIEYLCQRIDYANGEYDRANNHAVMYNTLFEEWKQKHFRYNEENLELRDHAYIKGLM